MKYHIFDDFGPVANSKYEVRRNYEDNKNGEIYFVSTGRYLACVGKDNCYICSAPKINTIGED